MKCKIITWKYSQKKLIKSFYYFVTQVEAVYEIWATNCNPSSVRQLFCEDFKDLELKEDCKSDGDPGGHETLESKGGGKYSLFLY